MYKDSIFSIFTKFYDDTVLLILLILPIQIFLIWLFFKVAYYLKTKDLIVRNIPGNYTVAMISMLHNKKIEGKKDVFATILNLINRGLIELEQVDDTYKLKNINDYDKMYEDEKYICDWITSSDKSQFSIYSWSRIIEQELKEEDLIQSLLELKINGIIILLTMFIGPFVIILFITFMVFVSPTARFVSIAYIIILISSILVKASSYLMGGKSPIIYNRKSSKIKKEIIGFRNFLESFSIIDKRNVDEIKIWGIYLTYAIVLGVNKKHKDYNFDSIPMLTENQIKSIFFENK